MMTTREQTRRSADSCRQTGAFLRPRCRTVRLERTIARYPPKLGLAYLQLSLVLFSGLYSLWMRGAGRLAGIILIWRTRKVTHRRATQARRRHWLIPGRRRSWLLGGRQPKASGRSSRELGCCANATRNESIAFWLVWNLAFLGALAPFYSYALCMLYRVGGGLVWCENYGHGRYRLF